MIDGTYQATELLLGRGIGDNHDGEFFGIAEATRKAVSIVNVNSAIEYVFIYSDSLGNLENLERADTSSWASS